MHFFYFYFSQVQNALEVLCILWCKQNITELNETSASIRGPLWSWRVYRHNSIPTNLKTPTYCFVSDSHDHLWIFPKDLLRLQALLGEEDLVQGVSVQSGQWLTQRYTVTQPRWHKLCHICVILGGWRWSQAEAFCRQYGEGAHLASIHSRVSWRQRRFMWNSVEKPPRHLKGQT